MSLLAFDVSAWDWSQLNPLNADSFQWKQGQTPLSNWQVLPIAIAFYFATIERQRRHAQTPVNA